MSQNMLPTLSSRTLISAGEEVVSCELDGESVLLDLKSSKYFRLNPVGAEIWAALAKPNTLNEICSTVTDKFEVEPSKCEADVRLLLGQLFSAGLIETNDG